MIMYILGHIGENQGLWSEWRLCRPCGRWSEPLFLQQGFRWRPIEKISKSSELFPSLRVAHMTYADLPAVSVFFFKGQRRAFGAKYVAK